MPGVCDTNPDLTASLNIASHRLIEQTRFVERLFVRLSDSASQMLLRTLRVATLVLPLNTDFSNLVSLVIT